MVELFAYELDVRYLGSRRGRVGARQDRDAETGGGERPDPGHLARLKDDPGFETGVRGRAQHGGPDRGARRGDHKVLIAKLVDCQLLRGCQWMVRGKHGHQTLDGKRPDLEAAAVIRLDDREDSNVDSVLAQLGGEVDRQVLTHRQLDRGGS